MDHHFLPAGAPGKIVVVIFHSMASGAEPGQWRVAGEAEFHGGKPTCAGRKNHLALGAFQFHGPPVKLQGNAAPELVCFPPEISGDARVCGISFESGGLQLLEGRNFRHVDHVKQFNLGTRKRNSRIMAHAEVTHGMGDERDCCKQHKGKKSKACARSHELAELADLVRCSRHSLNAALRHGR